MGSIGSVGHFLLPISLRRDIDAIVHEKRCIPSRTVEELRDFSFLFSTCIVLGLLMYLDGCGFVYAVWHMRTDVINDLVVRTYLRIVSV
jgi:hypothetical protein